jgi:hypothetical protein
MSVQYLLDSGGNRLVTVNCDSCHRSGTSDMLMDDDLCQLVNWTFDFGSVWCLLCQRRRGDTPSLAGAIADQAGASAGQSVDPHA